MLKKRGGARQGAGRPPKLTDLQRLQLGGAVERRLWRRTRARFVQSLDAKVSEASDGELPRLWAQIWSVPPADRHRVDLGRILHDVDAEIETTLQGRRYFPGPTKIAAGIRAPVIRSMARAASRRWKKDVTPRMVKRCLEEY
jgi:hypothetical protein